MTKQKTFKRRVRSRMEKTGESYTAARRMLIRSGDAPEEAPSTAALEEIVGDDAVHAATGRPRSEWFERLDAWDATSHTHTEMARWLREEHGVPGWWAQNITVAYEQARGLREPGQTASGFSVGATKTIAVDGDRALQAFTDEAERAAWLPGAEMRQRRTTAKLTARFDWEDGSTRVVVGITPKGDAKCQVAVQHERLPDRDTADAMKAYWRERLVALKEHLEA